MRCCCLSAVSAYQAQLAVCADAAADAVTRADARFVADVKAKTSALEQKWIKDAEAEGLKDAAKVLAEFRSEIAKQSK